MSFEFTLANLLADADGALAVMFVDETGETVDLACSELTPYDMRIVGAYVGIYLRQFEGVLERVQLSRPKLIQIEKKDFNIFAVPLPDGYFLVLVQRRPAVVALARRALERAREEMTRETFSHIT